MILYYSVSVPYDGGSRDIVHVTLFGHVTLSTWHHLVHVYFVPITLFGARNLCARGIIWYTLLCVHVTSATCNIIWYTWLSTRDIIYYMWLCTRDTMCYAWHQLVHVTLFPWHNLFGAPDFIHVGTSLVYWTLVTWHHLVHVASREFVHVTSFGTRGFTWICARDIIWYTLMNPVPM